MKLCRKLWVLLVAVCLGCCISVPAYATSYSGDGAYRGLPGIQPEDSLTLPNNTAWATLTANWGVRVNFIDWDEALLKTDLVPVSETTSGSSSAPADPTRVGYVFAGWERYDTNDGPATLNDDGTVTGVNGPGPIVFVATYKKINPEIEVTKKSDLPDGETASLGQTLTYTVTVANKGDVAITDITIKDELANAVLADGEADMIASLAPGKSAEVHFTYVVTEADILAGGIHNVATARGFDPNGDPVSDDGDSDDPVADDRGSDDSAVDDRGSDDPAADDRGSDDPAADDRGSDDPAADPNESSTSPQTGDSSNLTFWLALMGAAALCMAGALITRKKNSDDVE